MKPATKLVFVGIGGAILGLKALGAVVVLTWLCTTYPEAVFLAFLCLIAAIIGAVVAMVVYAERHREDFGL